MPSQVVHQIDNYTYLRRINNIKHPQDDEVFRNVTIPQQNALRNVKLNNVSIPLGFHIALTNRQLLQGVVLFVLLLVKHLTTDLSQRLIQFRDKHVYFSQGAVTHAFVVSILQIIIIPTWAYCCNVLSSWVIPVTVLSLLLEFLTHLHIDYAKSKFRVANQQRIDQSRSLRLAMHTLDQFLHAFFILCCTAVCTMLFSFE
ncbi:Transmembrane_domain-containing protein [Hexamita inflata]|uniref:Transmembrane domain-containing protein n=1 Tax=Hexamita inflata TaxID=28002 RepID=A0AA86R138_9EUKA|nr:Transmembrane domain-containing protein [Hexamita inflata]